MALTELVPGEMIVRIGAREVNARFVALHDCTPGMRLRGPRGGYYTLRPPAAAERVVVETYAGRPIVSRNATATVLREAE